MYLVGVIPGPTKPSGPEINHFLKLLVDDLLLFWEPGIRLSRTARYERGRSVLLALIPVVCDLLAAKQVTGFSGHQSTFFCTYCWLKLGDIENLERSTWPRRDFEEHLKLARAWRDAQTKEEQDQIYDERGVRWSELLRLPYWNPFQHTVIDTMHNLFLGLLHHHCRTLWGMDIKSNDSDLTSAIPTAKIPARPSQDVMQKAVSILDSNDLSGLTKLRKPVLWHLCADKGIRVASTINQLVRNLVQWVHHGGQTRTFKGPDLGGRKREAKLGKNDPQLYAATQQTLGAARDLLYCKSPIRKEDLLVFHKKILVNLCKEIAISHSGNKDPMVERLVQWKNTFPFAGDSTTDIPVSEKGKIGDDPAGDKGMDEGTMKKSVLGRNILSEIRKDMAKTQLPAWISPAPRNMGSTLHGKLTADQWKVACTIHLPITLIRIWGGKPEGTRLARMLANFIDLVVAVEVATMRIISEEDIEFYDTLMLRYLESMKELYKDGKVLPNHHLALHLREFLRSFGSVHAWRAFAFERYNYILQHENTNQKFGDMEGTFMRHTCRSANLRPLMQDPVVKSTVNDLVDAYDAMAAEDRRGTRVQDATARNDGGWAVTNPPPNSDLVQMEKEVYKAYGNAIQTIYPGKYVPEGYSKKTPQQEYLPRAVISCPKIFIAGVTYKPHKLSAKDSNIITRTGQAGRLEHIYRQSNGPLASEVHLVVRNLCDLSASDAEYDHYRKFPRGTGKLYYDQYVPKVTVLQPKDITCHFAKTPMDVPDIKQPCVHVLPLNIVRLPVSRTASS
ncbi:hypothetical protein DENSPDRAFT_788840 [Dentipellis sp. KUC8613]|nr:hypothetical protein DENSPDRAFT_788840 [Dentipellis sp. KUC8613]